jgi:hypothetical protein
MREFTAIRSTKDGEKEAKFQGAAAMFLDGTSVEGA